MEMEIQVIVKVCDYKHAKVIRQDILDVIKQRTTIFHLGEPKVPERSVEQLYYVEHPEFDNRIKGDD